MLPTSGGGKLPWPLDTVEIKIELAGIKRLHNVGNVGG